MTNGCRSEARSTGPAFVPRSRSSPSPLACRSRLRQQRRSMPFGTSQEPGATRRPGAREMTALLALLMALNAFAIDAMIPALPDIGRSLNVAEENRRQWVVVAYFLGFASTQPIWG